jgi:putative DNA-invertase from lambdoid prophage Rac
VDSTTPSGRFTLAILSAVAELERALIVERVKAGVGRARAKGKHLGRPRVALDVRPVVAMMEKGYGLKSGAKALGVPHSTLRRHLAEAHTSSTSWYPSLPHPPHARPPAA